jgi:PKD repeat protein
MNSLTQFNRNHGEVISSTARSKVSQLLPRVVWLVLLLVVLFGSNSQSQSISADFSNRNGSTPAVPTNLFGANGTGVGVSAPGPVSQLTNAGLVGTRIWVDVGQIYANPSSPNFSSVDGQLNNISALGLRPLAVMHGTPSSLGSSDCSVPSNVQQWGQMAAAVVAHIDEKYSGLVQDYEIWNEPDSSASLCVSASQALNDYLSIYAAAAPQMKSQAAADGQTIRVGGPVIAQMSDVSTWIPAFLSGATAPYVDFVSFHIYPTGQQDINNGLTWDALNTKTQATLSPFYTSVEALVRKGSQPKAATTPLYVTELNANWAYAVDGLRNDPTYGPLWNSAALTDLLNVVYNGAQAVPSKIFYFAAAGQYFCLLGQLDADMDCNPSATDPYPQFYTYQLFGSANYLNLQAGGNMAAWISTGTTKNPILATAFYNSTGDSLVIVNPTSTDYNAMPVTLLSTGLASVTGTSYLLNDSNSQIATESFAVTATSGGYTGTVAVPAYSTVAITLSGTPAPTNTALPPPPPPPTPVPPVPVLNMTPTSGPAPLVVSINTSASQGGGGDAITGETINFGDGTWVNSTPTTTHTYTKTGTYTVTVTLKNQDGLTATASGVVTVGAVAATSAVLNLTPASGTAPLVASINTSASQGNIVARTINFGDGSPTSTATTASHTYTNPGTYTVQLTVQDQSGTVRTASSVVTVNAAATQPSAVLSVTPASGTNPLVVTIDSSQSQGGSSAITGRTISFGDGQWLNWTPTTTHTYAKAGSYTVVLTVTTQNGQNASASKVITVN